MTNGSFPLSFESHARAPLGLGSEGEMDGGRKAGLKLKAQVGKGRGEAYKQSRFVLAKTLFCPASLTHFMTCYLHPGLGRTVCISWLGIITDALAPLTVLRCRCRSSRPSSVRSLAALCQLRAPATFPVRPRWVRSEMFACSRARTPVAMLCGLTYDSSSFAYTQTGRQSATTPVFPGPRYARCGNGHMGKSCTHTC